MDNRLALMAGIDIPIPECGIILHQPSIEDIAYIGETDFFIGVQTICLYKSMFVEEGKNVIDNLSNFQIFMTIMQEEETTDKKESVLKLLSLTFPKYKVLLSPRSLILKDENNEMHTIDENNFDFLQEIMRLVFCSKDGSMDQSAFNPVNDKAREIAKKLMRGRQRVAEQNGQANVSVFAQYTSILAIGLESMSLKDLMKCTMFQIYDLFERYMLYVNWDIDIRSRLAGGEPDSKPDNWMKNIH